MMGDSVIIIVASTIDVEQTLEPGAWGSAYLKYHKWLIFERAGLARGDLASIKYFHINESFKMCTCFWTMLSKKQTVPEVQH